MGLLQNLLHKSSEKNAEFKHRFKEAEMDMKIQKRLEERQKSSNERELEDYLKRQREARIKSQLDKIHDKQNKESWSGDNFMIGGKATILNEDKSVLKSGKSIMKEKNIFLDKKSKNPMTQKRMYFK